MKVAQLMTRSPKSCGVHESLARAAQIMWETDCGCVPVVDESSAVVGLLTDRDICMAAYTQGRSLSDIGVQSAMARHVSTCGAKDSLRTALERMLAARVRRLPVVDEDNKLVGVVSLGDVWRRTPRDARGRIKGRPSRELVATMVVVSSPRDEVESTPEAAGTERTREPKSKVVLRPQPRREIAARSRTANGKRKRGASSVASRAR